MFNTAKKQQQANIKYSSVKPVEYVSNKSESINMNKILQMTTSNRF